MLFVQGTLIKDQQLNYLFNDSKAAILNFILEFNANLSI